MRLLDEIKRDQQNGTPGPWSLGVEADSFVDMPTTLWLAIGPKDFSPVVLAVDEGPYDDVGKPESEVTANARRCVRVPDMEKALLAAEELAEAADACVMEALYNDQPMPRDLERALNAFRAATK